MTTIESIKARAATLGRTILLGDATDERVLRAAEIARQTKLATVAFVGDAAAIRSAIDVHAPSLRDIQIWSATEYPATEQLIVSYYESRRSKISDIETAKSEVLGDPLLFAALLTNSAVADGVVAGSLSTTASVIRAGLRGIGLAQGVRSLSSMFLLDFPAIGGLRAEPCTLAFADCAVLPNPDAHQLADIALSTASTYAALTGQAPRVAMLSFSTKGSAESDSTKIVRLATEIAKERDRTLTLDGELQFDAAFVPAVAQRKAPGSPLGGDANVFIFPNLDAGNLGYKIAERLGGAQAIGPILQGLAKPMNDLSRGASVDDIVTMIAVTALQTS
ncbi:MAG: phosphate acetyltransferase [Bacteroidetes bacterium]|nr:phosphate acetyltransferase [Bacteroidota bacterium]